MFLRQQGPQEWLAEEIATCIGPFHLPDDVHAQTARPYLTQALRGVTEAASQGPALVHLGVRVAAAAFEAKARETEPAARLQCGSDELDIRASPVGRDVMEAAGVVHEVVAARINVQVEHGLAAQQRVDAGPRNAFPSPIDGCLRVVDAFDAEPRLRKEHSISAAATPQLQGSPRQQHALAHPLGQAFIW
jgi:hypothetical protein